MPGSSRRFRRWPCSRGGGEICRRLRDGSAAGEIVAEAGLVDPAGISGYSGADLA